MLHDMSHHIWILADHISDQGMGYQGCIFSQQTPGGFNRDVLMPNSVRRAPSGAAGVNLPGQAVSFKKSFIGRCSGWASSLQLEELPPILQDGRAEV